MSLGTQLTNLDEINCSPLTERSRIVRQTLHSPTVDTGLSKQQHGMNL